jgi:squalene-hopene/tetraprenyl-beta-curcumene cyclase
MPRYAMFAVTLAVAGLAAVAPSARAVDDAHVAKAQAAIDKAVKFLRSTQGEDGSWTPQPGPAITGLVTTALLREASINRNDPQVAAAIRYILGTQQEDGGFYNALPLKNYNTSLAMMALSELGDDPEIRQKINGAQNYLRGLQFTNQTDPQGKTIDEDHPYFGGAGYGKHGRPDMSNTAIMLAALHDSGMDCRDPIFLNAMAFVERCQGVETNDMHGDKIVQDGGFIYATSIDKDHIGVPQSMASPEEKERALAGQPMKSKLRTYGSITYAGFMSYMYAQLPRDDVRVKAAMDWISKRYTLDENPGVGMQGYYYYLHLFARAMHARGEPTVTLADGSKRDWANDLVDKLVALQNEDGSWSNDKDRWMEGDPNLVTAYAILALQYAR